MQTKVKICGITSLEDALASAQAGADFLGYNFYAPSKRFIAPRSAGEITRHVRAEYPEVRHVGIFVDEEPENVAWIRNLAGLDFVQLHGGESPEYCAGLAAVGIEIIKVIGIGAAGVRLDAADYDVAYYLFDTHDDKLKGGTGRAFDLAALPSTLDPARMILAGGLSADNIAEILTRIRPFAVDVSSGVEERPGVKSHPQIERFISNVRGATATLALKEQI